MHLGKYLTSIFLTNIINFFNISSQLCSYWSFNSQKKNIYNFCLISISSTIKDIWWFGKTENILFYYESYNNLKNTGNKSRNKLNRG